MKQFEYKTREAKSEPTEDFLNREGQNGWELVCIIEFEMSAWTYVFKREKEKLE